MKKIMLLLGVIMSTGIMHAAELKPLNAPGQAHIKLNSATGKDHLYYVTTDGTVADLGCPLREAHTPQDPFHYSGQPRVFEGDEVASYSVNG